MIQTIQSILTLILSGANLCVLGYALFKFTKKPHDTLDQRVTSLEVEVKNIKESLNYGQDKFRKHDESIKVLLHSTLALIEFEIQYCLIEHKEMSDSLKKAKEDLHNFLSEK
jgi:hypothetical protein